jgi:threonine dehydrogenase-like Zn-dependent dehydrogenase
VKAMVYTGPHELQFMEVEDPKPAPGEVVVGVRAVGICASELEGVASQSPFRVPPLIMGHELAGIREDTNERIIVNPLVACLECDLCLRGQPNVCRNRILVGIQRPGGFAERIAVPEGNLYTAPPAITWEAAAVVEPVANAVHAWGHSPDPNPQRVGIIGAGTMGLVTLLVAKSKGVPEIDIADLTEARLAVASRLGASRAEKQLDGEYDVVVDAVGAAVTRRASVEHVRPGGAAVWIGLHENEPGFNGQAFIRTEKSVLSSFCYTPRDFAAAVRLAPTLDTSWITPTPLSEGVELFFELMRGRRDLLKVQLVP